MRAGVKTEAARLRGFVLLAYGITWVLLASWFYVFNIVYHEAIPGWMWSFAPMAFIGGWGPSVAALIVTARAGGRAAMGRLVVTLGHWRVSWRWYVIALILPPVATAPYPSLHFKK